MRSGRAVHGDAGLPLLASPAPSGNTVDAVSTSCGLSYRLSGGSLSRATTHFGIVRVHGPARPTTSASCRACPARPRRDAPSRTRTRSAAVASTPTAFRARGTFRRQVPFRPPHALTQGAAFRAATGAPALPPGAQLPTRVHARGPRARPKIVPGCSPEFPSHVPLVDFCNWAIHEHTQQRSRPRPIRAPASRRTDRVASPLARYRQPSFSRPGVETDSGSISQPPPRRPLAAMDLPQPVRLAHLLSPTDAWSALEIVRPSDRAVTVSVKPNQPARLTAPKHGSPPRAASPASSRKESSSTAPEVPSTPGLPSDEGSDRRLPADESSSWRPPSAFVSAFSAHPDEANDPAARPPRSRRAWSLPSP